MLIRQTEDCRIQGPASHSATLGAKQCQNLATLVAELMSDWSVELHYDVLGKPIIIILPDDLDDPAGATLVVREDEAVIHLEEFCEDTYRKLGEHRVWADVLRAIRIRLIWEMPIPRQFH
jgi:hypothetical protein